MNRRTCVLASLPFVLPSLGVTDSSVELKLSAGAAWQARNDVQIPNDDQGTRFALDQISNPGALPAIRIEGIWNLNDRHGVRLLLAPLSYSERAELSGPIDFAGSTFEPGEPVQAQYRFNSWRLGYRFHPVARDDWDLWVGGTLKVRDAEIRLTQGDTRASDDDVGLVPLLYLSGEYRFNERWSIAADLDGLAGGPGRAIDFGTGISYRLDPRWHVGLTYRLLEGGADTDEIYNFAWFNSVLVSIAYRR